MLNKGGSILLTANFIWILAEGMLGPLFAVFGSEVGGNILDISFAWALYLAITGVGIIFVGKLSDRIGRRYLMLAGFALNAIFTFAYLLVDSPMDLFLVQIGLGVALALAQPTWMALYDKYSGSGKNDGFVWGLSDGLGQIAAAIAILLGGFIVSTYSFDTLFWIMGSFATLATIYQFRILHCSE